MRRRRRFVTAGRRRRFVTAGRRRRFGSPVFFSDYLLRYSDAVVPTKYYAKNSQVPAPDVQLMAFETYWSLTVAFDTKPTRAVTAKWNPVNVVAKPMLPHRKSLKLSFDSISKNTIQFMLIINLEREI
ncbi:hypothetical protein Lal_00042143 [Lupinus albus]|nr:hypothetical protein Lal_00042143 [Lupinus albus]